MIKNEPMNFSRSSTDAKHTIIIALCTWLFVCLHYSAPAQSNIQPPHDTVRHMTTGGGVEFGLWGGGKPPSPVLFILANTIDGTLGNEYFRQCGNRLAREHGWLCVSLDLPFHGKLQKDAGEDPLVSWAGAAGRGEDFVADNNRRMKDILDYLIQNRYADPGKIFVCGGSRGGYLGLQFAAVEPRVR